MFQLSRTCLYYVSQSCKHAGVQLAGDIDKLETTACELLLMMTDLQYMC